MSELICDKCGASWSGERSPFCPGCLAQTWSETPSLIGNKHCPASLPSAASSFRSTLPDDFVERTYDYCSAIAWGGTALYSNRHKEYFYGYSVPTSGINPELNRGSAIPRGSAMPTHALNGFNVVKPFGSDTHIYPEDIERIQAGIASGHYSFLPICSVENCDNLQIPDSQFCQKHVHS